MAHNQTMKQQHLTREYRYRVRKILSTQLYGNYTVKAINSFSVPSLWYSAGFVHWTKEKLNKLTGKLMCLRHTFSMNSDIDRLYVPHLKLEVLCGRFN